MWVQAISAFGTGSSAEVKAGPVATNAAARMALSALKSIGGSTCATRATTATGATGAATRPSRLPAKT